MHWELEEIFHSEHKAKEYIDKMVAFEGEDGFIGEGGQKYHYQIKNWPVS